MSEAFLRCPASAARLACIKPKRPLKYQISVLALTGASLFALLPSAQAQVQEIDTDTVTPVATSSAANGSAADIDVTENGSITITQTDGVAAITVDSDNTVTNDGTVQIDESDNAVGILLEAGHTGGISGSGDIILDDNYVREDGDDDGDDDGALAIGSNRTAILLEQGGAFVGDITLGIGAEVTVDGNESHAILLQSQLDGSLSSDAAITVTGDTARGIVAEDGISGDLLVSGTILTRGENALAIETSGEIGGAFTIESTVQSTGFANTTVDNYIAPADVDDDTPDLEDRIDAEDLLDNTGTVAVRGGIANGILVNGNVDTFISSEDTEDETKDTIEDYDENRTTGSISSVGSGTALLIASGESDLTIGTVVETVRDTLDDDEDDDVDETLATFEYDAGLINRGSITANGLNVGFDALALRVEGNADGSTEATIEGGINNSGTIKATAFEADAVASSFGDGANIGQITNSGEISASTQTVDTHTATALLIEDGASLSTLNNDQGLIAADIGGGDGSAWAIRDLSSSLTSITNSGTIRTTINSGSNLDEDTGTTTAIDLSGHDASSGVSLVQERATPVDDRNLDGDIDADDVATPAIIGDILFGAGDDSFDLFAGTVAGDTDFGLGDGALDVRNGSVLSGAVAFDDGTHVVTGDNSTIASDFTFTDSTASFALTNGADFTGSITSSFSTVDLSVTDSSATWLSGNRSVLSALSVEGESELIFNIDPSDTDGAILNVNGTAHIGEDVTLTPVIEAIVRDPFTQTLVSADALTFDGTFDNTDITEIPYIYNLELAQTETDLDLIFDLKTAEELELDDNQARAYEAVLEVFVGDDALGAELAAIDNSATFQQTYNLLLPQRTNASHEFLSTQTNAAFGALEDRMSLLRFTEREQRGFWVQEYLYSIEESATVQSPGFNGDGFGLSFGYDQSLGPISRIGIVGTFGSGEFEEKTGGRNPVSSTATGIGFYAMEKLGLIELQLAGHISKTDFTSSRDLEFDQLLYQIDGEWSGLSQAVAVSAVSEFELGGLYVRPEASVNWFRLNQDGLTETTTGSGDNLNTHISSVTTDELSLTAGLAFGKEFKLGQNFLRAEVSGGYQSAVSATPYESTVTFVGSEESFSLIAPDMDEPAALFGMSILGNTSSMTSKLGYDLKVSEDTLTHILGTTIRLKF